MNRSLVDIVSDIALAPHDISITEEDVMQRVDELYVELHKKEDGIYWFYKNNEKKIEMIDEHIAKCNKIKKTLQILNLLNQ